MSKSSVNAVFIFLLTGMCLVLYYVARPAIFPTAQPAKAANIFTPLATQQPTQAEVMAIISPTPSPTLDYVATQKPLLDALATSNAETAKLRDDLSSSNNQLAAISAESTANSAVATSDAYNAKIVLSNNDLTAQANNLAILSVVASMTPQARKDEIALIQAQTNQKSAQTQATWGWIIPASFFTLAGAVIYLGRNAGKARQEQPAEVEQEPKPAAPAVMPAYPGGIDARLLDGIATHEQLYKLAVGIRQGVPFTHDNWTPAEKLMSEGRFASIQHLLVKHGGAEWVNPEQHNEGIDLTQKGYKFFDDIYNGGETTSPLAPHAPITPSQPVYRPIDDGFQPLG